MPHRENRVAALPSRIRRFSADIRKITYKCKTILKLMKDSLHSF